VTISLTDEARVQLDGYLRQVRSTLSRQLSVDVSDVERDILSHIDTELGSEPQPVGILRLRGVLDRLGAPDRWLTVDEAPHERQTSEDGIFDPAWRWPVVVLTLFIVGIMSFMQMILWPMPLLMFIMSVLVARAWLTTVTRRNEDVGARGWLVYPPLVATYALIASGLLMGPLPFVAGGLSDNPAMHDMVDKWFHGDSAVAAPLIAFAAVGLWWVILGVILYRLRRVVQQVFVPFSDWFQQRHAFWLSLAGFVVATASSAILFWISR
jgi:hypothetical protein